MDFVQKERANVIILEIEEELQIEKEIWGITVEQTEVKKKRERRKPLNEKSGRVDSRDLGCIRGSDKWCRRNERVWMGSMLWLLMWNNRMERGGLFVHSFSRRRAKSWNDLLRF